MSNDKRKRSRYGPNKWNKKRKKKEFAERAPRSDDIRDMVSPLWRLPYRAQLRDKVRRVQEEFQTLPKYCRKRWAKVKSTDWPSWMRGKGKAKKGGGGAETTTAAETTQAPPDARGGARADGGGRHQQGILRGVLRSPRLSEYRNKTEFSIGLSMAGEATVGFLLGAYKDGIVAVAGPELCPHISRIAKAYASMVQQFIRESSSYEVWDKRSNKGFWRMVTVREGVTKRKTKPDEQAKEIAWGDLMVDEGDLEGDEAFADEMEEHEWVTDQVLVMVQVCPEGLEQAAVDEEMEKVFDALQKGATSKALPLTTGLVQYHAGCSNVADTNAETKLMVSDSSVSAEDRGCIFDEMCGMRFRLSLQAFFQVNTPAAELLYRVAGEWARDGFSLTAKSEQEKSAAVGKMKVLFDVCCGTGTIGLTLAPYAEKVVGIELVEAAIKDAEVNAKLNNITNCSFICGKAEHKIQAALEGLRVKGVEASVKEASVKEEVKVEESSKSTMDAPAMNEYVAIVDPPRAGLHYQVIKALREAPHIRRLIYISCNYVSLIENAIDFCCPRARFGWDIPGTPFSPVGAIAVDLFPHTKHIETIMVFER